ncbi:MAG: hypothetical protein ABI382_12785 [Nakamurella sp.]
MPKPDVNGSKPPSLLPGVVLLGLAAALIILLLVKPDMPHWARATVASISIGVVVALLGYAVFVFLRSNKRGRQ